MPVPGPAGHLRSNLTLEDRHSPQHLLAQAHYRIFDLNRLIYETDDFPFDLNRFIYEKR